MRFPVPFPALLWKCWSSAVTPSFVLTLPFIGKVKSWQLLQAEFIQREPGFTFILYGSSIVGKDQLSYGSRNRAP